VGHHGTARVLIEYTKSVRDKGLLLEPVDIKKDLYGFVYAPERNSRGLYDPFRTLLPTTSSVVSVVLGQELGSSYKSLGRSCHDFKPA
jgi:hypothetical protein